MGVRGVVSAGELRGLLRGIDVRGLVAQHGSPLLLLDPQVIVEQYEALAGAMPGVRPHYAVKALSHPAVLAAVRKADGYFDAASQQEVRWLVEAGVDPKRCIYTNPMKKPADVAVAVEAGMNTFVFDSESDLASYTGHEGIVRLLLRLSFPNGQALIDLSYKFGVEPSEALRLMDVARMRGLKVTGLSFHAGSQLRLVDPMLRDIELAIDVMEKAEAHGHEMHVLDIGGGLPVPYDVAVPDLAAFAGPINQTLAGILADGIEVLSEPGRFVAAPSMICVSSVVAASRRGGDYWYYLDDGLYGSYSNILCDHVMPVFYAEKALRSGAGLDVRESVLAGPTCDSSDVMTTKAILPDLEVGDLVISPMMGAYTNVTATDFNGIPKAHVVVL